MNVPRQSLLLFLSTPSARRATSPQLTVPGGILVFLSTPSARRATKGFRKYATRLMISIHALREEGDHLDGCIRRHK